MKKIFTVYGAISTISYLIRQFCTPNPFENLPWVFATGFNWVFGIILFPVSFFIVGLIYIPGECPWAGSLAYFLIYFCIAFLVCGFMLYGLVWWMWTLLGLFVAAIIALIVWRLFRQFA